MNETFIELKELMEGGKLSKNKAANLYNLGFGALLIYLLYNLMKKHN